MRSSWTIFGKAVAIVLTALLPPGGFASAGPLWPTTQAQQAFERELRALLLEEPEIIGRILTQDPYADEKAADKAMLQAMSGALFDPTRAGWGPAGIPVMVMLRAPECVPCQEAEHGLQDLAKSRGVRIGILDVTQEPALAQSLGMDTVPSYVFPQMMVRGDVPVFVLEGYLDR